MCLKTVTNTLKPNDEMMVGYKVFRKSIRRSNISYTNLYFDVNTDRFMGEAYTADNLWDPYGRSLNGDEYKTYFHIYDSLEGAQRHIVNAYYMGSSLVICEVIAWDIRAAGTQGETNEICFIAKNYRIMREI